MSDLNSKDSGLDLPCIDEVQRIDFGNGTGQVAWEDSQLPAAAVPLGAGLFCVEHRGAVQMGHLGVIDNGGLQRLVESQSAS